MFKKSYVIRFTCLLANPESKLVKGKLEFKLFSGLVDDTQEFKKSAVKLDCSTVSRQNNYYDFLCEL